MTAAARVAPRAPDALDRFGERLAERVNPIVVKEIRQGLRTRAFWIFFSLMLLSCLVISLVAVATERDFADGGKAYFIAYGACLGVVQFFVIPYSAYRSMAREREEETWVLLTLTGLGPRRILRGKMGSYMLQGLLYNSAAAPFLLFSYYLNGVDLPTILLALGGGVAWQLFLTSLGVSLATLAASKMIRALLHFVVIGALLQGLWAGLFNLFWAVEGFRHVRGAEVLIGYGSAIFMMVTWGVLLYEAAAAHIALVTESYARGPRLAMVAQLLGMMGLFALWGLQMASSDLAAVGAISCSAHLLTVGIFVASDHDGMAKSLWLRRSRWSLLMPGALRGFQLVMLLFAAIGAAFTASALKLDVKESELGLVLAAPAYGALYLAAPVALGRLANADPAHAPRLARLLWVGLLIVGSGAPPLFGALVGRDPTGPWLNVFNPLIGLVNFGRDQGSRAPRLFVLWGGTLVLVLVAHELLRRRDNPPRAEVKR